jgi:hypothetical protein
VHSPGEGFFYQCAMFTPSKAGRADKLELLLNDQNWEALAKVGRIERVAFDVVIARLVYAMGVERTLGEWPGRASSGELYRRRRRD